MLLTLKCMFFLIKAFARNIELRVKLSYVFNIVPLSWNINEYRFRLGLTNLYSIDEYKNQSLLFFLKYFVLYELTNNPTRSFAEEQILFSPLK